MDREVARLRTPYGVCSPSTETGQAGLRPRGEPLLTVVEPGLILLRQGGGIRFAASAGGLLEFDGQRC